MQKCHNLKSWCSPKIFSTAQFQRYREIRALTKVTENIKSNGKDQTNSSSYKVIASQEMFVTGDKWLNFQKQIINADK